MRCENGEGLSKLSVHILRCFTFLSTDPDDDDDDDDDYDRARDSFANISTDY